MVYKGLIPSCEPLFMLIFSLALQLKKALQQTSPCLRGIRTSHKHSHLRVSMTTVSYEGGMHSI
jgi:hypothetical protein